VYVCVCSCFGCCVCTDCLRNLQFLLRRDDPKVRQVYLQLGKWDVIHTHLLPLLLSYRDDAVAVHALGCVLCVCVCVCVCVRCVNV